MEYTQHFKTQREFVSQLMQMQDYQHLNEQQIQQILHQRVTRFYATNDHINVSDEHYKPKIDPIYCPGDYTVDDTLILFGIDFLNSTKIKELFAVNDPNFIYQNLDASNCILRYSDGKYAKQAILQNLKKDSSTAFKIEQGQQAEAQENVVKVLPKQWIQLKPYEFIHFFRTEKLCPKVSKSFQRKLFVRYATDKEKAVGKVTFHMVDELYFKCEQIWRVEAQRDQQLKKVVYLKLKEFKERKDMVERKIKQAKTMEGIIENAWNSNYHDRSRSRNKKYYRNSSPRSKNQSFEEKPKANNEPSNQQTGGNNDSHTKDRTNFDLKQRNEMADMSDLIQGIKSVNVQMQKQSNLLDNKDELRDLCDQLGKLNFSKLKAQYIPIPNKLAQPSQLRRNSYRKQRFKYHEYIKKNEQLETKMRKFSEVDVD